MKYKVYRLYYRRWPNRPTQYVDVYAVSAKQAIFFFSRAYGKSFLHACEAWGIDYYYMTEDKEEVGTIKGVNYGLQENTIDGYNMGYHKRE